MSSITLSDIRAAAERQFASHEIDLEDGREPVVLVNPLRLTKAVRDKLGTIKEQLEVDDVEMADVLNDILKSAAKTPAQGNRLVKVLGNDPAVLLVTLNGWTGDKNTGEASASED
jgi:hypothetical protein